MTNENLTSARLAITNAMDCSYIVGNEEQLLFVLDKQVLNDDSYEQLLAQGFRRSGGDIYRPHCPSCSACKSLRVDVEQFKPSTSQKRVNKKNAHIDWRATLTPHPDHYPLYERYISERHQDGSMYPPNPNHMENFTQCSWLQVMYVEGWLGDKLIAVAVTDLLPNALSALYTFFSPELDKLSLGTACVLKQIEFAKQLEKKHVYLGYQIDECPAMNYKSRYRPHQEFVDGLWLPHKKASD
ncbi:arginyltransferase [Echinimonas agarilytica]|uniref:Aspartate/glutamate leucyltransferase n=1 Tax=Echinimonas agarilytica TaxID=1215918 RepID=A0AA41W895_9GAMM|nr:arginyltransferase [Echinimonas agarilytica]MCM2680765.1 arginyltransferase [Echinimonas agarilytica]